MGAELLLIRHAESEWNAEGRWQGHGDPPLSAVGREQAARLAERLRALLAGGGADGGAVLFQRLLCSDLLRARETAAALGAALQLEPEPHPALRELDVGAWTGLRREQIEARDPRVLARFEAEEPDVPAGGGESRRDIRLRARRAVRELLAETSAPGLIVVTHLGFIRALVPGARPGNTDVLHVRGSEVLSLRTAEGDSRDVEPPSPLRL